MAYLFAALREADVILSPQATNHINTKDLEKGTVARGRAQSWIPHGHRHLRTCKASIDGRLMINYTFAGTVRRSESVTRGYWKMEDVAWSVGYIIATYPSSTHK